MEQITQAQYDATLATIAADDMRHARQRGIHLVGQTKLGTLTVQYNANRKYTVVATAGTMLSEATAAQTKTFLARQYVVTLDNTEII